MRGRREQRETGEGRREGENFVVKGRGRRDWRGCGCGG